MPIITENGLDTEIQLFDGTIITRRELMEDVKRLVLDEATRKAKVPNARWEQGTWTTLYPKIEGGAVASVVDCKTDCCVAGWTVQAELGQQGLMPGNSVSGAKLFEATDLFLTAQLGAGLDIDILWVETADGAATIPNRAAELLGLTETQSEALFSGDKDAEDIVGMIDALLEDPDSDLDAL